MNNFPGEVASKVPGFGISIFSKMSALATKQNALNLAQGFPDFDTPPELIKLVNKHMKAGHNQYSPLAGVPQLREKLSAKFEKLYGAKYNPETEITITAGATQAIYAAITAVVRQDDEVIIVEPAYDTYVPSVLLNGGKPVYVGLNGPNFQIDWNEVKKQISYRTKMIIINTPHNPSGTIMSAADMKQLEKLVKGNDIIVLSDEVYEHIVFDGNRHESVCRYPELASRSFAIFSFGKTYHNTGWKMGYIMAPEALTAELRRVFQFMMYCAITPVQYAFADFLDNEEHYLQLNEFYEKKRNIFNEAIKASRFSFTPSQGTYFQNLDYSKISDKDDVAFAEELTKNHGIGSIPLSPFYHKNPNQKLLRFCFAKKDDTLKRAGDLICKI